MLDPHYTDTRIANLYDLDNPWAADTDFYMALAGQTRKAILDIGCGTGTLALGLAQQGHDVTGIDPADAMLTIARHKTEPNLDIHWHLAEAQSYRSAKRFDRIFMTGHAFQVLLDDADVLAVLSNMAQHLANDGLLAFESRNPAIDWDQQWATGATWELPEGKVEQRRSPATQEGEYLSFYHDYHFPDATLRSPSTLRFMPAASIHTMLSKAGLALNHLYGDWDSGPFDPERSHEMIFIASSAG